MPEHAEFLFAIGAFLLLGLAADSIGRRTPLPRVTLILICGVIVGDDVLALVPVSLSDRFELIADMALMMVGFLLGGRLQMKSLSDDGPQVLWISICAALGAAVLVSLALMLLGLDRDAAILLGCIAAATAPAATLDTILEYGGNSRFSRELSAIVAIDDAWALVLFSLGISIVVLLNGDGVATESLLHVGRELGGAVLLGLTVGLPAAFLTGRIRPGQPMLTEALGLVLACGGMAIWFEVSYLIATMTMGAVIANLARHHDYPFHEIENVEWPLMVIFFMLAGATLEIGALAEVSLVAIFYILARSAGKLIGAWGGAMVGRATPVIRHYMGIALLPQAGVAIGMALLAASRFPEYRQTILTVVIGTTVVFELIGPVATRFALKQARD
jgi:Kef-type K+ transport system membrane component KefB